MSVRNRNAGLPAVLTADSSAVLTSDSSAAVAARRLARRAARLLRELALGVAGLLGGSGAVEGACLAVETTGAGRVVGVCHSVLILKTAILFGNYGWFECFEYIQTKCLLLALVA